MMQQHEVLPGDMSTASGDEWLSLDAAAELCRVSKSTMKTRMTDALVVGRIGRGGARMVHRPSLEARLRQQAAAIIGA